MRDSTRSMVMFGVASLAAVGAGCVTMAASGVAPSSWLRTVAAWMTGAILAALLARSAGRRAVIAVVIAGIAALVASLFAADVDGVHRWVDAGPLHINVAALFLPAVIMGLAVIEVSSRSGVVASLAVAIVLLMQPDASQLTAFAVAILILLVRSQATPRVRAIGIAVALLFVAAGWMRPDPLQPVAEVEGVFAMCLAVSPTLAVVAGLALAATALTPLAAFRRTGGGVGSAALALAAYFVLVSIAPFVAPFPVPLVGQGMSVPIGWWLGVALLAKQR
jgi:hypothetical protein